VSTGLPLFLSILVPLGFCSGFILLLLAFYKTPKGRLDAWIHHRLDRWAFFIEDLGSSHRRQLALASFLGLFLEMLMIRWVSAEIPVFAYFKNLILISCFLGFGVGCYLARRRVNIVAFMGPLVLLTTLARLPWQPVHNAIRHLPTFLGETTDTLVWDVISVPLHGYGAMFVGIAFVMVIVALVTFFFIPVGQIVGWYLEKGANITAYTVNLLASLGGIVVYTLLCFLYQSPAMWFALAGAIVLLLTWRARQTRWPCLIAFALCILLLNIGPSKPAVELWSPYQKITLVPHPDAETPTSWELQTNDSWHQEMFDLSPSFVQTHPALFQKIPAEYNAYNIPYRFYQNPPSVLVLGSGTGNDVAAALRGGAGSVEAVEIDPLILKLGRKLHFEKPYQSPRVHVELQDARSYIQNSTDHFDVIVFSLLDSHTTASEYSNIRIDNYVYTIEAMRAARQLLRPDGIFIVKFWVQTPWIARRLYGLVSTAFGQPPVYLWVADPRYPKRGSFFIAGSNQRIRAALSDPGLRSYLNDDVSLSTQPVTLTTDDWPNFYQRQPGIPLNVIVAASFLILLWLLFLRQIGMNVRSLEWHFFFLGAGFMLLEAQTVSRAALLFGTTWVVNVVVVSGVLLLIVIANVLTQWVPNICVAFMYLGILLSLIVGYVVPTERLFFPSLGLRVLATVLLFCLPIFFAGLIFIRSFAAAGFSSRALGSNLFGALVGGLCELLSLWTGTRSLLIVAALFYTASWIMLQSSPLPDPIGVNHR